MSRDPWEGTGWRPATLNYYTYSFNNPVLYTDPSGKTPWDVIDFVFWAISVYEFAHNPGWGTAGWLLLDTACLAPIVPSVGYVRRGAQVIGLYDEIVQFATRHGDLIYDFAKIAHKRGAITLLRKFLSGSSTTVTGAYGELEYALRNSDEIVEIGRSLPHGSEIDFVLEGNRFVNVKSVNWLSDWWSSESGIKIVITDIRRQYKIYSRYADEVIFAFIDEVPQDIQESLLRELGESKMTIQFGP